ncbi:zinc transporter ZIP1-like [Uloborus diversus]|uniref:zinc transporter ZIP1-like n=1 Tax=Uloborus diversus TaxID=327109 RepID=UPI00240A8A20|nr:zinc transporter ZIP1-like [Uloborus diversus]
MDTVTVQTIILLVLLVGNLLFGTLPSICLRLIGCFPGCEQHSTGSKYRVVSFLIYFGGGVLISTCFLNLLPKSRRDFEQHEEYSFEEHAGVQEESQISYSNLNETIKLSHHHKHEEHFPMPEFIVLCGFFAAYVVMEVLQQFTIPFRSTKRLHAGILHKRFCSCTKRNMECSKTYKAVKTEQTMFGMEKEQAQPTGVIDAVQQSGMHRSVDPTLAAKEDLLRSSIIAQPLPNYGTIVTATDQAIANQAAIIPPTVLVTNDGSLAVVKTTRVPVHNKYPRDSVVTVFSLSFQAIMQGIKAGLFASASRSWIDLLLICAQQFLITFVVGCELLGGTEKLHHIVLFVAVLSMMSPVGVLISMFASNSVTHIPYLITGTLNAMTCGSLLYIVFYEILRHNRPDGIRHFRKFCAITLGSGIMAALEYSPEVL